MELSFDTSDSPHYYELELRVSNTHNGTFDRVGSEESRGEDVEFDNLDQGKYYTARGRNCLDSDRDECGDWSDDFSNTIYLPITPHVHPLSPPVDFRSDGSWHAFYIGADPNLSLKVVANPTGSDVVFVLSYYNPGTADHCDSAQQNQALEHRFSGNYVWIAACAAGTGRVQMQRQSNGHTLNTQTFSVSSAIVPTPTMQPTVPTPEPIAPPSSTCITPLGDVSGTVSESGQWISGCTSENRPDSYAKYYSFRLDGSGEATITLRSVQEFDTSGAPVDSDAYLFLLSGTDRNGQVITFNDDFERPVSYDSRIVTDLDEGDYTLEATTFDSGHTGQFTLTIDFEVDEPPPTPSDCDLPSLNLVAERANTVTGQWDTGCVSTKPPTDAGPGDRYAKFYTFTVGVSVRATIDLSSDIDTYLYLMEGAGTSNRLLYENDDIVFNVNLNSRIVADLSPGTYTIEATTYQVRDGVGDDFTLSIEVTPISADCSLTPVTGFEVRQITETGEWTNACITSTHSEFPGFSKFYGFHLLHRSMVHIDVDGATVDYPEVFIGKNAVAAAYLEGTGQDGGNTRIIGDLNPGIYYIEVTWPTDAAATLTSNAMRSAFTMTMTTYRLGMRPSTGTFSPSESTHTLINGDHFTTRIIQGYSDFSPYGVTFADETRLYARAYEGCLDMRTLKLESGNQPFVQSGTDITPYHCPPEFGTPNEELYQWFWFQYNNPRFLHGPAYP